MSKESLLNRFAACALCGTMLVASSLAVAIARADGAFQSYNQMFNNLDAVDVQGLREKFISTVVHGVIWQDACSMLAALWITGFLLGIAVLVVATKPVIDAWESISSYTAKRCWFVIGGICTGIALWVMFGDKAAFFSETWFCQLAVGIETKQIFFFPIVIVALFFLMELFIDRNRKLARSD